MQLGSGLLGHKASRNSLPRSKLIHVQFLLRNLPACGIMAGVNIYEAVFRDVIWDLRRRAEGIVSPGLKVLQGLRDGVGSVINCSCQSAGKG